MYYRRKLLLALLEVFDNELDKIRLQKLLMLFSQRQQESVYHFVPYKFGCFSFQANADLSTMAKYNQVKQEGNLWIKTDTQSYLPTIKEKDLQAINFIKKNHGHQDADALIHYTYTKFPYYAVNSTIAQERLTAEEYNQVVNAKPVRNETVLFTIGYEGSSLEQYLNRLIQNDVKVLCDVRRNPLSMKYGFSKAQLKNACEGVGIRYVHIPELGISSDKRQELNTQEDYDQLFSCYRTETLSNTLVYQAKLLELLSEEKRIALTCFEANICQCHRKHLAEAVVELQGFEGELQHI